MTDPGVLEADSAQLERNRLEEKRARRRRYLRLAVLALTIAVVILLFFLGCRPEIRGHLDAHTEDGGADVGDVVFGIAGDTQRDISPGISVPLDLELTNPYKTEMAVTGLRVQVKRVEAIRARPARPCSLVDFTVAQLATSADITVPARSTTTLSDLGLERRAWPRVGMVNRPVNQNGCKEASLTLDYTGSGQLE